jgi:hypothetical protein
MATSTQSLVRDNSNLTNFKQWAKAISDFFTSAGWTQSGDTGQVNWASIASVPTVGNYVYEIWQPGDALTTFYLKVEYGTGAASTNTSPRLRWSIGTATNGSGTLSGFVTNAQQVPATDVTVSSTSAQFQCHLAGDASRIAIMMWRDDTANSGPVLLAVQRSMNSSGTYTSSHVTLMSAGSAASNASAFQQSLVFGQGVSNAVVPGSIYNRFICLKNGQVGSDLFGGNIPMSPIYPSVGFFDNPLDIVGVGCKSDFTEGSQYTIAAANMPYGVSHVYVAGKNGSFQYVGSDGNSAGSCLLMRYD